MHHGMPFIHPFPGTRVYSAQGACPRCRSDLENRVARSGSRGALGPPWTQSGPKNVGVGTADVVRGRSELTGLKSASELRRSKLGFPRATSAPGAGPRIAGPGSRLPLPRGPTTRSIVQTGEVAHWVWRGGPTPAQNNCLYKKHRRRGRDHKTESRKSN